MLLVTTKVGLNESVVKEFRAIHWYKAIGYLVEKLSCHCEDTASPKLAITLEWE